MGIFYILLLVPLTLQHIAVKGLRVDYQKRNQAALLFFFVLLTVLVMCRHESVGNDTRNYIHYFQTLCRVGWDELDRVKLETGFVCLNKLIALATAEPQVYLAAVALLVSVMLWPTYRRLCLDASLTVVLFSVMSTFFMMFSGVRQMLAIGIGFIGYGFTRRRKPVPFVLSVLLAMSFHTSAFMLAFMYPLYHARITKNWLYAVAPALVLCYLYNREIFGSLAHVLEQYTKYDTKITSTGAYTMLILFSMFTVFCFLIPEEGKLDGETVGLRNFLLLTLVLQIFAPLHTLAMRMGYYYMIFIPLLLPRIIACRSRRWDQVAVLSRHVMVGFFLLYFFVSASNGALNVFPYHFFWERVG